MKYYAFRLRPGQDLKKGIVSFTRENKIKSGVILTCVGSLTSANIRLADERFSSKFEGKFEILSLVGTLFLDGCHLHISVGDSKGKVIGGHLLDESYIYTTGEIVIGEIEGMIFQRKDCSETGFKELKITGIED